MVDMIFLVSTLQDDGGETEAFKRALVDGGWWTWTEGSSRRDETLIRVIAMSSLAASTAPRLQTIVQMTDIRS